MMMPGRSFIDRCLAKSRIPKNPSRISIKPLQKGNICTDTYFCSLRLAKAQWDPSCAFGLLPLCCRHVVTSGLLDTGQFVAPSSTPVVHLVMAAVGFIERVFSQAVAHDLDFKTSATWIMSCPEKRQHPSFLSSFRKCVLSCLLGWLVIC